MIHWFFDAVLKFRLIMPYSMTTILTNRGEDRHATAEAVAAPS